MKKRGIKITSMFVAVTLFTTSGFSLVKGGISSAKADIEYKPVIQHGFYDQIIEDRRNNMFEGPMDMDNCYKYFVSLIPTALFYPQGPTYTEQMNTYISDLVKVLLFDCVPITDPEFVQKYGYLPLGYFFRDDQKYQQFRDRMYELFMDRLTEKYNKDKYGLHYSPNDVRSYFLKASGRISSPAIFSVDNDNIRYRDIFNKDLRDGLNYDEWKPFDYIALGSGDDPYSDAFRCAIVHNVINDHYLGFHEANSLNFSVDWNYENLVAFYRYFVIDNGVINKAHASQSLQSHHFYLDEFDEKYQFRFSDLSLDAQNHILEMFRLAVNYLWNTDDKIGEYCEIIGVDRDSIEMPVITFNHSPAEEQGNELPVNEPVGNSADRLQYLENNIGRIANNYNNIDYSLYLFGDQTMYGYVIFNEAPTFKDLHMVEGKDLYNEALDCLFRISAYHYTDQYFNIYFEGLRSSGIDITTEYNIAVNHVRYVIDNNLLGKLNYDDAKEIMDIYRWIGKFYVNGCSTTKDELDSMIDGYLSTFTRMDESSDTDRLQYLQDNFCNGPIHYDDIDYSKYIFSEDYLFNYIATSMYGVSKDLGNNYCFEYNTNYSSWPQYSFINSENGVNDDVMTYHNLILDDIVGMNVADYYYRYTRNYYEGYYEYSLDYVINCYNNVVADIKCLREDDTFRSFDMDVIRSMYESFRCIGKFYVEGCSVTPEELNEIIDTEIAYFESIKTVETPEEVMEETIPVEELDIAVDPSTVIVSAIPNKSGLVVEFGDGRKVYSYNGDYSYELGTGDNYEDSFRFSAFDDFDSWDYRYKVNFSAEDGFSYEVEACAAMHNDIHDLLNELVYGINQNYSSEDLRLDYNAYVEGIFRYLTCEQAAFGRRQGSDNRANQWYFSDLSREGREHIYSLVEVLKDCYAEGSDYTPDYIDEMISYYRSIYGDTNYRR